MVSPGDVCIVSASISGAQWSSAFTSKAFDVINTVHRLLPCDTFTNALIKVMVFRTYSKAVLAGLQKICRAYLA